MKTRRILISLLFIFGMVLFFGPTDNWAWDPSFYYAHIRSPIIENDLDFRNETVTSNVETEYTVTGLQNSIWPVGPSILWSPFFLVAHVLVLMFRPDNANGFYFPYISMVSVASISFGVGALLIIYAICRRYASQKLSIATVVLCVSATPLFFYIFRQPINAHTTGLFASAAILLTYLILNNLKVIHKFSGLLFGVLLGMCFLTRWSGILLMTIPISFFLGFAVDAIRIRDVNQLKIIIFQLLILTAAFLITISPQMTLWYRLHDQLIVFPQGGSSFVESLIPINFFKIFFDTNRGLLFWCPFVFVGIIGLGFLTDRRLMILAFVNIFLQSLLIGYRIDWYSGGGFGARYFIEILPFTVIGFVTLSKMVVELRTGKSIFLIGSLFLIVHQSILVFSIEHAVDGWANFRNYLDGVSLGVKWQFENFFNLLQKPSLWFSPRPYVAENRQSIITNLILGVRDYHMYMVTGAGVLFSIIVITPLVYWYDKLELKLAVLVSIGVMIYFFLWSLFYLNVG